MQKALASISLILILVFHFSGNQLLFHIHRSQIRREIKTRIKQGVPQGELIRFKFSTNSSKFKNLQWHDGHEFRLNGRMYDVVRKEQAGGDSVIFHCIDDHQETALFTQLDKLVKNSWNESPAREQHQKTISALSVFYLSGKGAQVSPKISNVRSTDLSNYSFAEKCWAPSPDAPPPRMAA